MAKSKAKSLLEEVNISVRKEIRRDKINAPVLKQLWEMKKDLEGLENIKQSKDIVKEKTPGRLSGGNLKM